MGVPTSEVGYDSAMPRREDHEVHKRTCGGIGGKELYENNFGFCLKLFSNCLVLITDRECVYCPVQVECLNTVPFTVGV